MCRNPSFRIHCEMVLGRGQKRRKISDDDAKLAVFMVSNGFTIVSVAKKFGVSRTCIYKYCTKQNF